MAEQVLSIMEIILDESNAEPLNEDKVRGTSPSVCRHWGYILCLVASNRLVCVSSCVPQE